MLILLPSRHFTYVTAHSPTLPSLYLHHSSFSNLPVTSPTSQLILQPFRRFTYVTAHSPTLPLLHLRHSSFSSPSFAFPTSQAPYVTWRAAYCIQMVAGSKHLTLFLHRVPKKCIGLRTCTIVFKKNGSPKVLDTQHCACSTPRSPSSQDDTMKPYKYAVF